MDITLPILIALPADQQSIRFGPGVLPALRTGELGLAGRLLGPGLEVFRRRLPVKNKAGGCKLGIRLSVGPAWDDVVRNRLAGLLAAGFSGGARLKANLFHLCRPLSVMVRPPGRPAAVLLPDVGH